MFSHRSALSTGRRSAGNRLRMLVAALSGGALALVAAPQGAAVPGAAAPEPSTGYPSGVTTTRYIGPAFDACRAPSLAAMRAWKASPYRAVGIYFGGVNRSCAQRHLTAAWVGEVSKMNWRLLPIYKGLQPPCGARERDEKISHTSAYWQGRAAAADAIAKGRALGLMPGSAFYNDIEAYSRTDRACKTAVLRYLSGWTRKLHAHGYLSGVYMNLNFGAKDLAGAYHSTTYARPDALWIARYDGSSRLSGWEHVPDTHWAGHQRAKQYRNSHDETHGGVTINIDSNRLDAPVATVGRLYKVTSRSTLNGRRGPSASYPVVRTHAPGSTVAAVCQTHGSRVGTTSVWDRLSDGTYLSDYYVSTPSNTGYSASLPRC